MDSGLSIRVRGTVQGVGFRPFVYRLAERHGLTGWVRNSSGTVEIEIDGAREKLEAFLHALRAEAPDVAHIDQLETTIRPAAGYHAFAILVSQEDTGWQAVSADIATCDECLAEILDPAARRYHYPFTNCTNCGPRFTIIESLPYDRARTTMRAFPMCDDCRDEFENPRDRRFHAQPIACPRCGPRLWLHSPTDWVHDGDPIIQTAELLRSGKIIAIKGLGGFQLACDATNEYAVARLRERKHRYGKPLAIMVATLQDAAKYIELNENTRAALLGRDRPIVVAPIISSPHHPIIASSVRLGLTTLGVMLPYTPLHHLLLREAGLPLVMTSGNMSEEPIATGNEDALKRLSGIADAFLLHNRDIYSRYDDSVIRVGEQRTVPIRRARSQAPAPIALPFKAEQDILAVGPQQKNTFALIKESSAFVSQHIGDLDNYDTTEAYRETLEIFTRLFKVDPKVVAYDMHPDYFSTRYAREHSVMRVAVQHHHAHVVSCMVENGLKDRVIGVAYDGTGYGTDGAIWGCEVLVSGWRGFERAAHLRYTPLIGGEAAVRDPRRMAASHIWTSGHERAEFAKFFDHIDTRDLGVWSGQFEHKVNAPATSSCGRLFDAFAALLGVSCRAHYEGEPAVLLEAIADTTVDQVYPYDLRREEAWQVDPATTLLAAWRDMLRGRAVSEIAAAVHNTVADWTVELASRIREETNISQVCLSGGCFQNLLLLSRTERWLQQAGFDVFTQVKVPPNDGGVALGQAAVAFAISCTAY